MADYNQVSKNEIYFKYQRYPWKLKLSKYPTDTANRLVTLETTGEDEWATAQLEPQTTRQTREYYINNIHSKFVVDSTHIDQPYPTAKWLRTHDYFRIRYTLVEHHDRAFTELIQKDINGNVLQHENGE